MKKLTHLSLFSGIGGADLAAEWAGFTTVGQCEWADYPTKVLEKHWPDVPKWRDIRTLTKESFYERTGLRTVDLVSGGFPCQPHSLAGKRLASADDRDLWWQFARVVCEIKPTWMLGENVPGLLSSENGRFFGRVLRDLAVMGYRIGWGCFPAVWVGGNFARDRVFLLAIRSDRVNDGSVGKNKGFKQITKPGRMYGEILSEKEKENSCPEWREITYRNWEYLRNEPDVGRVANGVPNRVDRLKCLGNAIVPQQFYPVFKAIAEIETGGINCMEE